MPCFAIILMTLWGKIRRILPFIGIAIFIYLLIKLNVTNIFDQIKSMNLFYILLAGVIALIYFIFQTLKWFVIAQKQEIKVPFKEAIKINLITNFYGFITPGRLGSVIRADYL